MDCLLFRHGIAAEREEWDGPDSERPLTGKGVRKTRSAAEGLATLGLAPSHILSSPFVRAHQTAKLLQEVLHPKSTVRLCDELLPDSPPDKIFPLLDTFPVDACVICVGHEPLLGELAGVMVFGKPAAGLALKKAGAALIRFSEAKKSGHGQLVWWIPPALLRTVRKAD